MALPWESVIVWGALAISIALGVSSQLQLWLTKRHLVELRKAHLTETGALRQRIERDRNTIDSEVASYLNLSREELSDIRGRFEKFKEQVEGDLDDISADMDVIENSVASCVRASRASPFSSLNLQFLNDGLDDVRARLGALELAAQKAKLASQGLGDETRPLWLVQREKKIAGPADMKAETAEPKAQMASESPAPSGPEAAQKPRRPSFADFLAPTDVPINDDTPAAGDAEPLQWPGSLSRIAAF